jgi:hypothetical protein
MSKIILCSAFLVCSTTAWAFENTKVLPKGVRKLTMRHVQTNLDQQTDEFGHKQSLAQPLAKELTFAHMAQDYEGLALSQIEAFLKANGFEQKEALGSFTADFSGKIAVTAPIFAYGISDKMSLGFAMPVYQARTNVAIGFRSSARAQEFLNALTNPYTNQNIKAREAMDKLNNAPRELNSKLVANGYKPLGEWSGTGLGDATLLAKYAPVRLKHFAVALGGGVNAPTGRRDDPDILTDVAFGDGQWDLVGQLILDQPLNRYFFVNQYVQYTNQLPGRKDMRLKRSNEELEVDTESVQFKLGDKVDAGVSLQYEGYEGVFAGVGYNVARKFADRYYLASVYHDEERVAEARTEQQASDAEFGLGFSTINAYQRGTFAVPFETTVSYKKHLKSKNMPVKDLGQVDVTVFF